MSQATMRNTSIQVQLKKYYSFYTGGFIALRHRARDRRADGHVAAVDRLLVPVRHHRPVRRHRHHEPHRGRRRVLRRRTARAGVLQRHGDRRRLDERGLVHRHGRHAVSGRLSTASPSSWAGPAATAWWRCSSRPTCASSASSRFPTSSARATAATSSRIIGIFAAILCSFTYVVAQIYGVGLITSRFTGLEFGVGVFVGLGGILVCSFLGGMRAVTWTQVAQYIILIIAYLIAGGLAVGEAHRHPDSAARLRLRAAEGDRAREEARPTTRRSWRSARSSRTARPRRTRTLEGPAGVVRGRARRKLEQKRRGPEGGQRAGRPDRAPRRRRWTTYPEGRRRRRRRRGRDETGLAARAAPPRAARRSRSPARTKPAQNIARRNFLAHRVLHDVRHGGAAAHPDALLHDAQRAGRRASRCSGRCSSSSCSTSRRPRSRCWRSTTCTRILVGSQFAELPAWAAAWAKVDPTLLSITDINKDGIVQLAEIVIGGDIIVLATPEIAGLPYVVSGPGGGGRSRGGAVDRRRPAADDRQRAVARPLLQDDRPERVRRSAA